MNTWAVGSRGRNPDNPSDRKQKSNGRWKQRLEVGDKGVCNCISSVSKDFMYMGKIVRRDNPRELHPVRTEYGKAIRKDYEARRVNEKRRNIQRYEPRSDGLVNTITTVSKDTLYISRGEIMDGKDMMECQENLEKSFGLDREWVRDEQWYDERFPQNEIVVRFPPIGKPKNRKQAKLLDMRYRQYIREEYSEMSEIYKYLHKGKDGEWYGIFKLSVRECGRLQGLSDGDIDKMDEVNSNSQLYKQIGNSICVPVLMAIFSQLHIKGIKPWNDMTDEERYDMIHRGCYVKGEVR